MKNRSQIYDMNRSRPSHGHRYTKYKIYFFIMMVIRPVEMKKILGGGATNFEILSATMVERRKTCLISDRLKGLEKFNICTRWVM